MPTSRHRLIIALLCSLWVSLLLGCGPSTQQDPRTSPPPLQAEPSPGDTPASDPKSGSSDVKHTKAGEEPALYPLDAPLETLLPEGEGEARAVEDLGPPAPVLLFSASLKGYVEPCTCTLDVLLGGIDRIGGYVRTLQSMLSASVMIDAGNTLFEETSIRPDAVAQARLKAALILDAHRALKTQSTTPGPADLALGVATYRELVSHAKIPVTISNIHDLKGQALGDAWRLLEVGALKVGLTAVADPTLFTDLKEVKVDEPMAAVRRSLDGMAIERPDVRVAVVQGDRAFARRVAMSAPSLDFVIVGFAPRETDEVTVVGDTMVLEAFDQGRYVGVLKLYTSAKTSSRFKNARSASRDKVAMVDRRIKYLDEQLDKAPPALKSAEPPFVKKLRSELEALKRQRLTLSSDTVDVPPAASSFAYFAVPMTPGYPHDRALWERKQRYNARLETLYTRDQVLSIPPPAEGQASYVGDAVCADCHEDAMEFWEDTAHSHAWATLEVKNKTFDPECVSCHSTGYGQPGGGIVGQLDHLKNVQCETCHGPGSIHAADPEVDDPTGQVWLTPPKGLCVTCHDPLNSPRFDYDKYLPLILGDGHEAKRK